MQWRLLLPICVAILLLLLARIVNRLLEVGIYYMRGTLPSKDQMHLRQQCPILGISTKQIRVRNSTANLPLAFTLTVIPLDLVLTIPRTEVGVEVGCRTIISHW